MNIWKIYILNPNLVKYVFLDSTGFALLVYFHLYYQVTAVEGASRSLILSNNLLDF